MLEKIGHEYRIVPVNIGRADQFKPEFLAISPNNRMPAIVDHAPKDGGEPVAVFESLAILVYLAEKSGQLLPTEMRPRLEVLQWLAWQVANLGPMAGQAGHFRNYVKEPVPYATERYTNEVHRLYGVMNRRLADREYLAGDYSVADIASWPWVVGHKLHGQDLEEFPNLRAWFDRIAARPAAQRGRAAGAELRQATMDDEARKILFNQRAR